MCVDCGGFGLATMTRYRECASHSRLNQVADIYIQFCCHYIFICNAMANGWRPTQRDRRYDWDDQMRKWKKKTLNQFASQVAFRVSQFPRLVWTCVCECVSVRVWFLILVEKCFSRCWISSIFVVLTQIAMAYESPICSQLKQVLNCIAAKLLWLSFME